MNRPLLRSVYFLLPLLFSSTVCFWPGSSRAVNRVPSVKRALSPQPGLASPAQRVEAEVQGFELYLNEQGVACRKLSESATQLLRRVRGEQTKLVKVGFKPHGSASHTLRFHSERHLAIGKFPGCQSRAAQGGG
jgi:hypothetical protein